MSKKLKVVVIPKEYARFRLDEYGNWHNEHEKFKNRKIINYFHSCIEKDKDGYHLAQVHSTHREKVYFPYEDTALFVFDIRGKEELTLLLNNKSTLVLNPEQLFEREDFLYVRTPDHCIKFSQHALVRISKFLDEKDDRLYLNLAGKIHKIPQE